MNFDNHLVFSINGKEVAKLSVNGDYRNFGPNQGVDHTFTPLRKLELKAELADIIEKAESLMKALDNA